MPALPSSSSAPPAPSTSGPPPSSPSYSRLHITPFDADLLKTVVPAATLPHARNISFHTLETFPENRYGFVELPAADAEKVKRKFHGSTLRGQKMRVEKARPERIPEPTADEEDVTSKKRKKRSYDGNDGEGDKKKKRKRDLNTFEGVLLPEGRKVKRGWTVTAEEARKEARKKNKKGSKAKGDEEKEKKKSKKVVKSKYTDKEECLMKVVLPPNAPALVDAAADEKRKRKKKKAKAEREVVVHEFENTKKFPSFIKTTIQATETKVAAPSAPVPVKVASPELRAKARPAKEQPPKEETKAVKNDVASDSSEDDSNSSSSSDSSSDSDSSDSESEAEPADVDHASSESEAEDDKDEPASPPKENASKLPTASSPTETRPKSSSSMKNLSIKIPPHPATPAKVHPLEALYKRTNADTATSSAAAAEPFTFFGGADEEDDEEEEEGEEEDPSSLPPAGSQPPMTPFTRQDFELRNLRSAAPTPDTAHPSRTRGFWEPSHENDINEEEEEEQQPTSPLRPSPSRGTEENKDVAGPVGDFQNWFYENRRELNRSWMNRRRTAKKERRQRENRARAPRG